MVRQAVAWALAGLLVASGFGARADEARPNIVLLLADDLGWGDVGFNGRTEWATPQLDRLARRGTVFTRFYAAAAVCNPSRATFLTGKSTIHCGVSKNDDDLPAREVTIAEALQARGYATALFGKWHHGAPRTPGGTYVHPMDQGFDDFFGFTDATHAWEKYPRWLWNGRQRQPVTGYADDLFADRAIAFLEQHRGGPFFLYVPFTTAHFQIEAPADEVARFAGKFPEAGPSKPLNATYAAMVSRLDRNVGRILAAIDGLGLADNTLIVFASDQGATFESGNLGTSDFHDSNRPLRGQKRTLWEGGIRVPAVAAWPGKIAPGTVSNDVFALTDLMPTFLAAGGGQPDPAWKLDGRDVLPAWTGSSSLPARTLFWEWRAEGTNQMAAMRGDLKLVVTGSDRPELFDVVADPAERRNIAAQHPEIAKSLHEELKAWLATGASF